MSESCLRRQRQFGEVHQGCPETQVGGEAVVEVKPYEGLALLAEPISAVQAYLDRGLGIKELAVEDLDTPDGVVYGVVDTFGQWRTASSDTYRARSNIYRTEGNLSSGGSSVRSSQIVFVLL